MHLVIYTLPDVKGMNIVLYGRSILNFIVLKCVHMGMDLC